MAEREEVVLTRNVNVVMVPDGHISTLDKGEQVTIHQALGNNYTVVTAYGHMVRIASADADALGKEPPPQPALASETDAQTIEQNCWNVLRTVYDPEIPVNIVELGLVYECKVTPQTNDPSKHTVNVMMTLTAPGCGMGPVIQGDVEKAIRALPGVASVAVEVVLDPPWSRDMMSDVARLQLGLY